MKAKSRRQFTAAFKAKVVLEVLRQEKTLSQIASENESNMRIVRLDMFPRKKDQCLLNSCRVGLDGENNVVKTNQQVVPDKEPQRRTGQYFPVNHSLAELFA